MNNKTCNRCGKKGLDWDLEFHEKTGKWKLDNHKVKDKWCNKPKEILVGKKSDYDLCELCSDTSFGKCRKEDKAEHLRKYHPHGEVLTELDWIMTLTTAGQYWLQNWKSDKHYYKYENKINK